MFLVCKGNSQIKVETKEDANAITYVLNELDCPDSLTKKQIIGGKPQGEKFNVSFMGKDVTVLSRESVEELLNWLLVLGTETISIERMSE